MDYLKRSLCCELHIMMKFNAMYCLRHIFYTFLKSKDTCPFTICSAYEKFYSTISSECNFLSTFTYYFNSCIGKQPNYFLALSLALYTYVGYLFCGAKPVIDHLEVSPLKSSACGSWAKAWNLSTK